MHDQALCVELWDQWNTLYIQYGIQLKMYTFTAWYSFLRWLRNAWLILKNIYYQVSQEKIPGKESLNSHCQKQVMSNFAFTASVSENYVILGVNLTVLFQLEKKSFIPMFAILSASYTGS